MDIDPQAPPQDAPVDIKAVRAWFYAAPFLAAAMMALLVLRFDLLDPMIRPFALEFGTPTTALVSSKRVSTGRRTSGNYLSLNYQYSPDYAPRPELKVNDAAYAAVAENSRVAIHFIPGCSSCIALDEDYGSARQQAVLALAVGGFVVGAVFLQTYFRR
ncbi:MAG: hypothetical protein ACHQ51_09185 [Elusimicrobiota bacterium]